MEFLLRMKYPIKFWEFTSFWYVNWLKQNLDNCNKCILLKQKCFWEHEHAPKVTPVDDNYIFDVSCNVMYVKHLVSEIDQLWTPFHSQNNGMGSVTMLNILWNKTVHKKSYKLLFLSVNYGFEFCPT